MGQSSVVPADDRHTIPPLTVLFPDWGLSMIRFSVRSGLGVSLAAMGIFTLAGAGTAVADTPTGVCTDSYTPYTFRQLSRIDSGLTSALFSVIDSNGDGIVCFKAYSNGPHNGHLGNLVDDKAAPHT